MSASAFALALLLCTACTTATVLPAFLRPGGIAEPETQTAV